MEFNRFASCAGWGIIAALAGALASPGAFAEDYYAGKTLDLIVGAKAGGGYDIYARTVARHLSDHIPGHPTIIVKNMPGAGSARAAGYVSNIAPKDGTSLAAIMPGAVMDPILDPHANKAFDPTKVVYIGTANSGTRVCVTRANSNIKTFDDALKHETLIGATSSNDSTRDYAYLHKRMSGAKFKIVTGYAGTVGIGLAMERGEVDGACGWDWSSLKSQKPDWIRDHKVNVLVQDSIKPNPELTRMEVPSVWNYVKNGLDRSAVKLILSQQVFLRSYIAPPGTPAEEIKTLRTAFDETVKDPALLADAKKMHIEISPLSGEQVQSLVKSLYETPQNIVDRARRAILP